MKKVLFFALAAGVALAACTKNEVRPVEVDQEITFKTISTKATETEAYKTGNTFRSWAYLHNSDYAAGIDNQLYLGGTDGLVISYKDNEWRNADAKYYWPKNGDKLSFYSYALNSSANTLAATAGAVSCTFEEGIKVVGYDIVKNLNVDFLVADVAQNQTKNTNPKTYFHVGVPTLFRHKLSNVAFTIKTADTYANKTFTLKSITLKGVAETANYIQAPFGTEGWDVQTTKEEIVFCNTEVVFSNSEKIPTAIQSYYIPQTFSDKQTVEVVYTIKTENGTNKPAVETVTVKQPLSELFGEKWEMGTKYSCAITVSLNEILWDPAVQPWVDGPSTPQTI